MKKEFTKAAGLKEYKEFLQTVANEGLGYSLTDYPPEFNKMFAYDPALAELIDATQTLFGKLETRVMDDMKKFGIEG